MSRDLILAEIKRGPKTVAQLLDVVQGSSGYVSSACQRLVKKGQIKRVGLGRFGRSIDQRKERSNHD